VRSAGDVGATPPEGALAQGTSALPKIGSAAPGAYRIGGGGIAFALRLGGSILLPRPIELGAKVLNGSLVGPAQRR
jgi:hypothetical protein